MGLPTYNGINILQNKEEESTPHMIRFCNYSVPHGVLSSYGIFTIAKNTSPLCPGFRLARGWLGVRCLTEATDW